MKETSGVKKLSGLVKPITAYVKANKQRSIALGVAATVAIIGLAAMQISGAATYVISLEAESGNVSGNGSKQTGVGSASGSSSVMFGGTTPPTTPPPTTPPPSGGNYKQDFIYRDGRKMMLNGGEYKFVGFNAFGLTGCHTGSPDSQATMDAFFGGMRPKSMTRTWAFESISAEGIDRVVKTAEKYNQKVMLALGEGAGYCGAPKYDANWYRSGYKGAYFSWISKIVPKYKDSPAVVWEIMNEPGQASGGGMSQADMKAFYQNTAAHIKANDPNHLVSTGTLDSYQSWQSGTSGYADVHSGKDVDLISMHEYEYFAIGNSGAAGRWGQNVAAAKQVNKPIFVGEFGVVPKGCVTPDQRASVAKGKYDAYLNAEGSGALYWSLTNPGSTSSACNSYDAKDAYNGPVYNMTKNYSNSNLPTPK